MKCLSLILLFITFVCTFAADVNIYKKDFDSTGKAFYFTPSESLEGYKIAIGEQCTKVVVYMQDANGVLQSPSEQNLLSTYQGTYVAEIIRYPGGKCALPDTQKYGKEIITSPPEDLVNYYNGKKGPLPKYSFKTEDKATPGAATSLFQNKWIIIGVGAGALLLILIIVGIIIFSRRNSDDEYDYEKRFSTSDKDMKKINEPYVGLTNNDTNTNFNIGQPFNPNISNPITNYSNNWKSNQESPLLDINIGTGTGAGAGTGIGVGSNNFLSAPEEPKRVNSITYEEQQNYSSMMKKQMDEEDHEYNNPQIFKQSSSFSSKPRVPERYENLKTFKIVRRFTPQRDDELVVEIGHMVKMIKSFEDGWSLCYNINTGKEGYIPKNKLSAFEQPQKPQNIFHSDTTSTTSSAYSTKPLLHSNSGSSSNYSYSNNNSYGRNRGQRPINSRKNSSSSRSNGGSFRGSPNGPPNKYYRRPSNDEYINNGYRSQNRYDM